MTPRQKLELRRNDVVKRLNEIVALEGDDYSEEVRAEEAGLKTELGTIHNRIETAIVAEGEDETRAAALFDDDGEGAELRALRSRVRLASYVGAAVEQRSAAGAEGEYNEALGIPGNRFPLDLLAPEVRATTDADASTSQSTWVDRLFSETAAMRLGVTFESVMPGISAHPVTTAGASAAQRGRREAAADTAWTVSVIEIKPTRNSVRAIFTEEDAARLPSVEQALRRDLSMALMEGVDRAIFLGDGDANEDTADITGLATATGVVEKELTQAEKATANAPLEAFISLIDGKHATEESELRIAMAVGANSYFRSRLAVAQDAKSQANYMRENGLSWMTRGDLADDTAANSWAAFVGRQRGIAGAGVAAVWNSGLLIRDPYSGAAKGEVAMTLSYLWGFALPRAANFARIKFVA